VISNSQLSWLNNSVKKVRSKLALFAIVLFSSCGLFRALTLNKKMFKKPVVAQKDFKQQVKFRFKNGWIYIYARVNESDSAEFMLDTGAPSYIGFETKDALKIRSKKVIDSLEYSSLTTQIGNIRYKNATFLIMEALGIKRLIGVNIMQNQIWSFNFRDSVITITDRLDYMKDVTNGYKVHFTPHSIQKTPVIKLVINGNDSINVFLDIGDAGFINLYSGFNIAKVKTDNPGNVKDFYYKDKISVKKQFVDTTLVAYDAKLNSLKLGGFEVKNIIVQDDPNIQSRNLVGLGFLKHFIITIDWLNNDVYFKPIEERPFVANIATYGFNIYHKDSACRITVVYKNSEAEKKGIKCGDEIESINGTGVNNINKKTWQIIQNNEESDAEIVLKIKDKKDTVRLKKYSLFQ
jgi:predicted aspartyl protease